jgi:hypothetical protein
MHNSTMESLRQVCALNNKGVKLVLSGDNKNGVVSFQNAIAVMQQQSAVGREHSSSSSVASELGILHPDNAASLIDFQQDSNFVYDLPFLLQIGNVDTLDDLRVSLYSATLLFNLALGFHKRGRQGKSKALERAANLYQMSLQVLEEPMLKQSSTASLLAMVALNNKANCHWDNCDYNLTQSCGAELYYLLSREITDSRLREELPPGVLDSLLLNSFMMIENLPTASQAA